MAFVRSFACWPIASRRITGVNLCGRSCAAGQPDPYLYRSSWPLCLQRLLQSGLCQRDPLHDGLPGETITVVEGLEGCHSANISPDNRTLWVPALKQDRICLFTLSDDGFLRHRSRGSRGGAGPRHMVFHPNQQYGYNELNSSIDVWELKDPKGNIECVQTTDMMPPDFSGVRWAADIHITPDGRHLYACDRTASIITVFSVSEDGSVLGWKAISLPRPSRAALTSITAVNISLPPGRSRTISRCTISSVSRDCCRRKAAMRLGRADVGGGQRPLNRHQVRKTSP